MLKRESQIHVFFHYSIRLVRYSTLRIGTFDKLGSDFRFRLIDERWSPAVGDLYRLPFEFNQSPYNSTAARFSERVNGVYIGIVDEGIQ